MTRVGITSSALSLHEILTLLPVTLIYTTPPLALILILALTLTSTLALALTLTLILTLTLTLTLTLILTLHVQGWAYLQR